MNDNISSQLMLEYIDHVVIYVTDMEKSLEFYTQQLELPLRSKSDHWSEVGGQNNGVYIGLHLTNSIDTGETTDVCFRVSDINKARNYFESNGIKFYDDITQISPVSWFTSFTDPDGNKLSIYQGPSS